MRGGYKQARNQRGARGRRPLENFSPPLEKICWTLGTSQITFRRPWCSMLVTGLGTRGTSIEPGSGRQ